MQGKRTPLHRAAREGHNDIVTTLLQNGANPNALANVSLYLLHTLIQTHLRQWIDYPDY